MVSLFIGLLLLPLINAICLLAISGSPSTNLSCDALTPETKVSPLPIITVLAKLPLSANTVTCVYWANSLIRVRC